MHDGENTIDKCANSSESENEEAQHHSDIHLEAQVDYDTPIEGKGKKIQMLFHEGFSCKILTFKRSIIYQVCSRASVLP